MLADDVDEMKPKVESNTTHREQSEVYQEWMRDRVTKLESKTDEILREVRK